MSRSQAYDLIIVGGGAIGLATAYQACKENARVLVLEQYDFMNQLSSSSGGTRQFRIQYAEEYMARLVHQSIPFWDELQSHTGDVLRTRVGSVWFGDPNVSSSEGQIQGAMHVMEALGIPFEALTASQLDERYKFKQLPADYTGFLQPDGGTLNVPGTLRVMLEQVQGRAELLSGQKVTGIQSSAGGVTVSTTSGTYQAGKLVVTAGPYTNQVLAHLGVTLPLTIWQMVSCYFKKSRPEVDFPSWFVFEAEQPEDPGLYYGFEEVGWSNPGYIRVAPAFANHIIQNPDERTPEPDARDIALTSQWVASHMPDLEPEPHFTSWCLAALPEDDAKKMYLDFAPPSVTGNRNVVIFAGGWAFKFVPLLGRICADLALRGTTTFDISHFTLTEAKSSLALSAARKRRRLVF